MGKDLYNQRLHQVGFRARYETQNQVPDGMENLMDWHIPGSQCHIQSPDQQNKILSLYYQNLDVDTIAQKLSLPKGEVRLVIDLKEKFIAMEKNSR